MSDNERGRPLRRKSLPEIRSPVFISHELPPADHPRSLPATPGEVEEASWNLIPYVVPNVPADPSKSAARAGAPPGCLFLRSATPPRYKRTVQACDQCRDKKAKCTGAKPSCTRCDQKGEPCTYTHHGRKRTRGPELARARRRARHEGGHVVAEEVVLSPSTPRRSRYTSPSSASSTSEYISDASSSFDSGTSTAASPVSHFSPLEGVFALPGAASASFMSHGATEDIQLCAPTHAHSTSLDVTPPATARSAQSSGPIHAPQPLRHPSPPAMYAGPAEGDYYDYEAEQPAIPDMYPQVGCDGNYLRPRTYEPHPYLDPTVIVNPYRSMNALAGGENHTVGHGYAETPFVAVDEYGRSALQCGERIVYIDPGYYHQTHYGQIP